MYNTFIEERLKEFFEDQFALVHKKQESNTHCLPAKIQNLITLLFKLNLYIVG